MLARVIVKYRTHLTTRLLSQAVIGCAAVIFQSQSSARAEIYVEINPYCNAEYCKAPPLVYTVDPKVSPPHDSQYVVHKVMYTKSEIDYSFAQRDQVDQLHNMYIKQLQDRIEQLENDLKRHSDMLDAFTARLDALNAGH